MMFRLFHKFKKEFPKVVILLFLIFVSNTLLLSQKPKTVENDQYIENPIITSEDSLHSIRALQKDITELLNDKNLNNTKFGVVVYSLDTKKYIYRKNPDEYLTPGSNSKLYTALGALMSLGKNFQVRTSVYIDGEVSNNILNGDIYIYGRGDALLSTSDIEYLADKVRNFGIKEINGNVIADGTFFDEETERVRYSNDRDVVQSTPPITALSLEQNVVQIIVNSGSQSGRPVGVQTIPASEAFTISNQAKVVGGNARPERKSKGSNGNFYKLNDNFTSQFPNYELSNNGDSKDLISFQSSRRREGISVSNKVLNSGFQQFVITGNLEANQTSYHSYFISKPNLVVAGALKNRMASGGVVVKGNISEGSLKISKTGNPKFIAEFSRPLLDIAILMNKKSDNYLAETMFKLIGANSGKMKDNAKEAQQVIFNCMDSLNVFCEKCAFNDGSGLSRRNLTSANCLVQLLTGASERNNSIALDTTLSIAGVDGTLRNRMIGTGAENNLKGKTGTLNNVSSLAGYVTTLDNEKFAFAFIFNGPNVGYYKRIEDRLGEILSQFFYFNKEN